MIYIVTKEKINYNFSILKLVFQEKAIVISVGEGVRTEIVILLLLF
jgi:hypothetical protein